MVINATRAFMAAAAAASIGAGSLPASALTVTTEGDIQFTAGDWGLATGATVLGLPAPTSYNGGLALGQNVGYTTSDGPVISFNGCCNGSGATGIMLPTYPVWVEDPAHGWTPMALNGQPQQTDYIQEFGTNGATIKFAQAETYLGLMFGTLDPGDEFLFYNGSSLIGTVTESEILDQMSANTVPVNFEAVSGQTFNKVVLSDPNDTGFQVGDIVYSQGRVTLTAQGIAAGVDQTPLPPLAGSVPGILSLLGFLGLRRRKA